MTTELHKEMLWLRMLMNDRHGERSNEFRIMDEAVSAMVKMQAELNECKAIRDGGGLVTLETAP